MRQWMVDPTLMCGQHLRGEHVEHHMFVGSLVKGISVQGYIEKGLLDISKLESRHHEIVQEMLARGGRHKSPLPWTLDMEQFVKQYEHIPARINVEENIRELHRRCPHCRALIDTAISTGRTPDIGNKVPDATSSDTPS